MEMFNIGPTYLPPNRYLMWAYREGEVSHEEAYSLLVGKYGFGKEGAKDALAIVKQYPNLVHKPTDYDVYRSKIDGTL